MQATLQKLEEGSLRRQVRTAGILYMIIILAGIFAEGAARSQILTKDAVTTAHQLVEEAALFRSSILSDIIMIICDVLIGMVFFVLLRSVHRNLALLTAFFRLAQAAALGLNLVFLWLALQLVLSPELFASSSAQAPGLSMLMLQAHSIGYKFALVFFAGSLVFQAFLFFKSKFFPNWLGVLLLIAAAGYLIDTVATIMIADYQAYAALFEMIVIISALGGELTLCLWLLFKKIDPKQRIH